MPGQKLTPQEAFPKIKNFCAYQERCHSEARDKLYGYGLHKSEVEAMISDLITENFLNEERFATHFAGGKFRIKKWGKVKIKYELRQKNVSDYCIKTALAAIDNAAYADTLERLAQLKLKSLKSEKNQLLKKQQLQRHLKMKGYESGLVEALVSRLVK